MKIYVVENQKTKEIVKVGETNRKGLAMLFYGAIANWEVNSKSWNDYCKKYPNIEDYDRHLDNLEIQERKEFFSNLVENNNKYNYRFKIISVELAEEKER